MRPLNQLAPGVEPTGDTLVYLVQSQSRHGMEHRVDLAAFDGWGACSCESFAFRMLPHLKAGEKPNEEMECEHIEKAKRFLAAEVCQTVISQKTAQSGQYDPEAPQW